MMVITEGCFVKILSGEYKDQIGLTVAVTGGTFVQTCYSVMFPDGSYSNYRIPESELKTSFWYWILFKLRKIHQRKK